MEKTIEVIRYLIGANIYAQISTGAGWKESQVHIVLFDADIEKVKLKFPGTV